MMFQLVIRQVKFLSMRMYEPVDSITEHSLLKNHREDDGCKKHNLGV